MCQRLPLSHLATLSHTVVTACAGNDPASAIPSVRAIPARMPTARLMIVDVKTTILPHIHAGVAAGGRRHGHHALRQVLPRSCSPLESPLPIGFSTVSTFAAPETVPARC